MNLKGVDKIKHIENEISETPLVSICVMAFRHEKYLTECLNSILFQQTNFNFEVLIGEDDSPDNTRKICIDYANKYPKKIRLFLHDRSNVVYINGNPTGRFNFVYNLIQAKGKYIAICEGDDYWKDPLKLQKQVDFFEQHEDYSLCFTNRINYNEQTGKFENAKPVRQFDFNLIDYLDKAKNGIVTATATSMFRAKIFDKFDLNEFLEYSKKSMAADTFLFSIILTEGRGKILKDETTVYRVTGKGVSSKFTNPIRYKIRITTYSFLLDKKLVKDKSDRQFIEKRLKELKYNYFKNQFLTFTNKIGLNSIYKKLFKK